MSDPQTERNPVEVLADEFAARFRKGEFPLIAEYTERYPDHAEEINELFPSIVMMEQLKRRETATRLREERRMRIGGRRLERVGDYQLIREIGRGGMGVVFEAVQTSLDRRVAVKILSDSTIASEKQVRRFEREARAAAALHHTNIVPVFGVGHEEEVHFYVMQYIDGVALDEILAALRMLAQQRAGELLTYAGGEEASQAASALELARALRSGSFSGPPAYASASAALSGRGETEAEGHEASTVESPRPADSAATPQSRSARPQLRRAPLPPEISVPFGPQYYKAVARIGLQIANALRYAHGQSVLHRDIKPGNLLLDPQGTVWVTDFGLAKLAQHHDLTRTGDIVGTLRYMAPEQFDGKCDARCDVYSLGLTLYELLTLRPACDDKAIRQLIEDHSRDRVAPPRASNRAIPADLETVVLKAIAAEPADRYQTAEALAADLERFLDDRPILARRFTPFQRFSRWSRRNPALAGSTAAAVLFLILAAVISTAGYFREKSQRQQIAVANERAEANLQLALNAFEGIIDNLGSRGALTVFDLDFDSTQEDDVAEYDTVVTPADARLLSGLLVFFDEFAQQNSADLKAETAKAYARMGDIQHRLGSHDEARTAYYEAIRLYRHLPLSGPESVPILVARAETMNELARLERRKHGYFSSLRWNQRARTELVRQPPEIASAPLVRFTLAQTYLNMFSRNPAKDLPSVPTHSPDGRSGSGLDWEANLREAQSLLEGLLRQEPENPKYLLAQAQMYRSWMRMAHWHRRNDEAVRASEKSLAVFERLVRDFPNQPLYRFELAGTHSMASQLSEATDVPNRLQQAKGTIQELVEQFPNVPEYQHLLSKSLVRIADYQEEEGQLDDAERHYYEAIVSLEPAVEKNHYYQSELSRIKRDLADLLGKQGALGEARTLLEQAVEELEQKDDPQRFRWDLIKLYERLETSLQQQGDTEGVALLKRKREALEERSRRDRRKLPESKHGSNPSRVDRTEC